MLHILHILHRGILSTNCARWTRLGRKLCSLMFPAAEWNMLFFSSCAQEVHVPFQAGQLLRTWWRMMRGFWTGRRLSRDARLYAPHSKAQEQDLTWMSALLLIGTTLFGFQGMWKGQALCRSVGITDVACSLEGRKPLVITSVTVSDLPTMHQQIPIPAKSWDLSEVETPRVLPGPVSA